MAFYLNKIPGYREALLRAKAEDFRSREDNFLALPHFIAGRKVRVMTVRDYVALLRLKSPFICRSEPTFEDVGMFLWVLSPEIEQWHNHAGWRKHWLVGCRWRAFSLEYWQAFFAGFQLRRRLKVSRLEAQAKAWRATQSPDEHGRLPLFEMPLDCELARAITATFEYVDRVFMDRPVALAKGGTESGLLYLTSWFDVMQSEYHFSDETVWRMPMPQLFGRLKAIAARRSPGEPDFNSRQDALASRIQRALQKGETTEDDLLAGRFDLNQEN